MKNSLSLNEGKTVYEFDDEAEFEGKKFISFKRITEYKGQKKYQNFTSKVSDWPAVMNWLLECLDMKEPGQEAPF